MREYEKIYREMLVGVLNKRERFTQLEVSRNCGVSIGLVNKTIKRLAGTGSIDIQQRQFRIIDPSKILFDWAVRRNIKKDITESYFIDKPLAEIEKSLPFILTAYSGWRLLSGSVPFDYGEVYVYVPEEKKSLLELWLNEAKPKRGRENVFIMVTDDRHLIRHSERKIAPLPQIFVDIYSLSGLAGKYFIKDILEKYPEFKVG